MARDNRIRGAKWEYVRARAFKRDMERDARCWICVEAGKPDEACKIDYTAPACTPNAWEPDHFLTVKQHPELQLDITNIRPSHSSCNRARNCVETAKRKRSEQLGNLSRKWV